MGKNLENCSREELIEQIKNLKRQKKFGLVWEDKLEKVVTDCENKLPVLADMPEKSLEFALNEPTNIIIEGDNYHALSVLNYTHAHKIDVIYIDPPYNTGNKDFVYNDCYVDKEDSFRHSKWLSFMEKRLRLAKNLLADDGVIFISIDDNEQAQLKMLCDNVFSEDKRLGEVGTIIWLKRNSDTASINLAKNHEYVCAYQSTDKTNVTKKVEEKIKLVQMGNDFYIDKGEPLGFGMLNINNRPKLGYSFYFNEQTMDLIPVMDQNIEVARYSNQYEDIYVDDGSLTRAGYIPIRPKKVRGKIKCWGTGFEKAKDDIDNYKVVRDRGGNWVIHQLKEVEAKNIIKEGDNYYLLVKKEYPISSIVDGISSKDGTDDLYEVINEKNFPNPKPVELIKYLIRNCGRDSIILDFFAGSGTTGQAVLELNKEDGGHRQFILCTNNENRIAENVTYPRIKTVIAGVRQDGSKYSDGIPANLRYLKTDFVEKGETTDDTREALIAKSTDMICVRENAFKFVASAPEYCFYKNAQNFVAIIFDQFTIAESWAELEKFNVEKLPVKFYCFSYNRHANEEEIPEDTDLEWVACPIPESVLEVYRKIFRKKGVR